MLTHEWRRELDAGEAGLIRELTMSAAEHDAEAGFSRVDDEPGPDARHLLVWPARNGHRDGNRLLAYLRVREVDAGGVATVQLVVGPEDRSRGVATLLLERLADDRGWEETGAQAARCTARATHPAAERIADRFDLAVEARTWWLVRPLRGQVVPPLEDEETWTGDLSIVDGERAAAALAELAQELTPEDGSADRSVTVVATAPDGAASGVIRAHVAQDRSAEVAVLAVSEAPGAFGVHAPLLCRALEELRDRGERSLRISMPAQDTPLVRLCRRLSFHHEQTDTSFRSELPAS